MSLQAILWALHEAPTDDPQSTLVLVALAENAHDNGRYAWPSVETIAKKARCSERTVHRRLRELEDLGLIRRGDQRAVMHLDPRYRPVVYDLGIHLKRDVTVSPLSGSRGDSGGSPGVTPVADEPSLEPTTNPPTPQGGREPSADVPLIPVAVVGGSGQNGNMDKPAEAKRSRRAEVPDSDPSWSAFWSAYPRKVSKGSARRAWSKAAHKTDPAVIIAAAQAVATELERRRKHPDPDDRGQDPIRFVPHPATWLNREQWGDDVAAVKETRSEADKRYPPKKHQECPTHTGQWADNCAGCRIDRLAKD